MTSKLEAGQEVMVRVQLGSRWIESTLRTDCAVSVHVLGEVGDKVTFLDP